MAETPNVPSGTLITWTFANWVTVVLMAMIAFGIAGLAQKWWSNRQSAS